MPVVSVQKTERYEQALVDRAVAAHFEALGIANDLKPDMKVLIKPNLLTGRDPSKAVTTHPAVLRAVAKWLRDRGVTHITLADSPGGVYSAALLRKYYATCGYTGLADLLTLTVCGNAFLYNMVRIITGTMLDIGMGRKPEDAFRTALKTGDRLALGITAPACGLELTRVYYADEL